MNANIQKTSKKIKICPTCGAPLLKVHRNIFYKLMSGFIYSRRYKCSNKDCQFEDLKISKKSRNSSNPFKPYSPFKNKLNMFLLIIFIAMFWSFVIDSFIINLGISHQVDG
jgi:hypothetical protein